MNFFSQLAILIINQNQTNMNFIDFLINFALLAVALAFIFWGFKIFKIYIIILGIFIGGVLGLYVGALIEPTETAAYIGLAVGAVVGGLIAWPLQKVFVFIAAGLFLAIIGLSIVEMFDSSGALLANSWYIFAIIFFIIGGIIAMVVFDYIVIIIMAMTGVQMLINIYMPAPSLDISATNMNSYFQDLLTFYETFFVYILYFYIVFVLFALYFQKGCSLRNTVGYTRTRRKIHRRTAYLFAILMLLGFVFDSVIGTNFLNALTVTGLSISSWPIIIVLFALIFIAVDKALANTSTVNNNLIKFIAVIVMGAVLLPVITWVISSLLDLKFSDTSYLTFFYSSFIDGPAEIIVSKWIFTILVLPGLAFVFFAPLKTSSN